MRALPLGPWLNASLLALANEMPLGHERKHTQAHLRSEESVTTTRTNHCAGCRHRRFNWLIELSSRALSERRRAILRGGRGRVGDARRGVDAVQAKHGRRSTSASRA